MNITATMQRVASILNDSNQLIAAVTDTPSIPGNRFREALDALRRLANEEGIAIAIVGGAATISHGYPRSTHDIDVVVAYADFQRLMRTAHEYGFEMKSFNPFGLNEMFYKGVPIEVMQEGMFESDPEAMLSPQELGVSSFGFASLEGLIRLKLSAGRAKDLADIVELLKNTSPEKIQDIYHHLGSHNQENFQLFDRLVKEAEREKKKAASHSAPKTVE